MKYVLIFVGNEDFPPFVTNRQTISVGEVSHSSVAWCSSVKNAYFQQSLFQLRVQSPPRKILFFALYCALHSIIRQSFTQKKDRHDPSFRFAILFVILQLDKKAVGETRLHLFSHSTFL